MPAVKAIDSQSVHRIQSGQVIIDLCSVVKELVENSIDAAATSIEVRFKEYGLQAIEVQDDGDGIRTQDQASVALKHYTSKLSHIEDLASLNTYGFRGEALSSLSALSDLRITTARSEDAPMGRQLIFDHNGHLQNVSVSAARKGTLVTVTNIFHNLPVRRKELEKNIKREYNKVIGILYAYACVRTGIRMSLSNQTAKGKKISVFATNGNDNIRDNILNVFGTKVLNDLIPLHLDLHMTGSVEERQHRQSSRQNEIMSGADVYVRGHISRPSFGGGRHLADRQMFFVNSRPCALPQLSKVFNEVYKSFNAHQSPFILADLRMDTENYDVNVSPDKRSILLHNQGALLENLKTALTDLLQETDHVLPTSLTQPTTTSSASRFLGPLANTPFDAQRHLSEQGCSEDFDSDEKVHANGRSLGALPSVKSSRQPTKESQKGQSPSSSWPRSPTGKGDIVHPRTIRSGREPQNSSVSSFAVGRSGYSSASMLSGEEPTTTDEARSQSNTHSPSFAHEIEHLCIERQLLPSSSVGECSESAPNTTDGGIADGHVPSSGVARVTRSTNSQKDTISQGADASKENERRTTTALDPITRTEPQASKIKHRQRNALAVGSTDRHHMRPAPSQQNALEDADSIQSPPFEEIMAYASDPESDLSYSILADTEDTPYPNRHSSSFEVQASAASSSSKTNIASYDDTQDRLQAPEELLAETERRSGSKKSNLGHKTNSKLSVLGVSQDLDMSLASLGSTIRSQTTSTTFGGPTDMPRASGDDPCDEPLSLPAWTPDVSAEVAEHELSLVVHKEHFSHMKIVGQFNLGFVLAVRPAADSWATDELFIIDQHAADEKWNYERLYRTFRLEGQPLVIPKPLELTAIEEELVSNNRDALLSNGFEIEQRTAVIDGHEDGDEQVARVKAVYSLVTLPISGGKTFSVADFEELLHLLSERPTDSAELPRPQKVQRLLAMRACRSSIMIGRALTVPQMESIVRHLGEMDKPWNCPHGRPTMRHLASLKSWSTWAESRETQASGWLRWAQKYNSEN